MRALSLCLLFILLSCSASKDTDAEHENLRGSLLIRGVTVFGYENNKLSYQLKSRYMIQSSDKNELEFRDFVMQKMDEKGISSLYLANKVTYSFKEKQAFLEQADVEAYHDETVLTADTLLVDYITNTLTGQNAKLIKANQEISGKTLFYDLISKRMEFTQNVEGYYAEGTNK